MSADEGGWGIGGYVPVGYEVTPWATLFPGLARPETTSTLKSGYLAKLYTYYFTRLQFGQYLRFLADVGPEVCENNAIYDDVDVFERNCTSLLSRIEDSASAKSLSQQTYDDVTTDFATLLSSTDPSQRFYSAPVYNKFFSHYEFFVECAYGFIVTWEIPSWDTDAPEPPGTYYLNSIKTLDTKMHEPLNPPAPPVPENPFTLHAMLGDAVRGYPVLTPTNRLNVCFFDKDEMSTLDRSIDDIENTWHDDNGYFRFEGLYSLRGYAEDTCYGVGLNSIPNSYSGAVRGLPMFYKMPFDFLLAYAGGKASTRTVIRQE